MAQKVYEGEAGLIEINMKLLQENKRLKKELETIRAYWEADKVDAHRWRLYRKAERRRLAEKARRPWWKRMLDADDDHVTIINMAVGAVCFCGFLSFLLGIVR